jgi:hypothetical protein
LVWNVEIISPGRGSFKHAGNSLWQSRSRKGAECSRSASPRRSPYQDCHLAYLAFTYSEMPSGSFLFSLRDTKPSGALYALARRRLLAAQTKLCAALHACVMRDYICLRAYLAPRPSAPRTRVKRMRMYALVRVSAVQTESFLALNAYRSSLTF